MCFHLPLHLTLLFTLPFQNQTVSAVRRSRPWGKCRGSEDHTEPLTVAICDALIPRGRGFYPKPHSTCGASCLIKPGLLWVTRKLSQPHWFGVGGCGLSLWLLFKSAVIYHSSLNQLRQLACVIKSHFRELFAVITLMTFKQNKNLFWTFRIIFFWTFRTNVEFFKCLILFGPRVFQGKNLIWEFFTSGQDE